MSTGGAERTSTTSSAMTAFDPSRKFPIADSQPAVLLMVGCVHLGLLMTGRIECRLALGLAADCRRALASRGNDEVGNLAALKSLRRDVVDPAITAHRGSIVKSTSNGMFLELASAVDAGGPCHGRTESDGSAHWLIRTRTNKHPQTSKVFRGVVETGLLKSARPVFD
jgi:hypothetical protein